MSAQPQEIEPIRLPDPARDGYHQCWYPVAMSSEVAAGTVTSKEFLDGRVVIWRGADGVAHVHSAFCRHLGADLAVGKVLGNRLQCVFHRWEYGGDGRCVNIPVTNVIPPRAKLFDFPTQERWGLIWAFNGEQPLYEVPGFPTMADADLAWRVFEVHPLPIPPWLIVGNTHDFQHVRAVHNIVLRQEPAEFALDAHTVQYEIEAIDPNLGPMTTHFRLAGTNSVALENRFGPMLVMSLYAGTPISGNRTKGYTVTATPRIPGADIEKILDTGEGFARNIMAEDDPLLESIRFRADSPIAADHHLVRWIHRAARYPAAHPSKPFIT